MKKLSVFLCVFLLVFGVTGTANLIHAAIITNPGITNDPNNDDFIGQGNPNNNIANPSQISWGGVDSMIWAGSGYDIQDSGGTTEYLIAVGVGNNSELDWIGYKFILGFNKYDAGLEEFDGPFIPSSYTNGGFVFDSNPSPNSSIPLSPNLTSDTLYWSGEIARGAAIDFTFSIDVPDSLIDDTIWIFSQPVVVPIPSAVWLLGSGLIGLIGFRRKFRKA